jgi:integrase/recombinase XerD
MAASNIQISRFHPAESKLVKYSGNVLNRAIEEERITEDDSQLIQEFVSEISATRHISAGRGFKLHYTLVNLRDYVGPFKENTIADIYSGIDRVRNAKKQDGNPRYKQNSISDYVRFLKRFYLWMIENKYTSIDEKKIQKIQPPSYDLMTKTPDMLLSEEEIRAMIEACQNSRDRALLSTLYEGGFRIGEIGTLRWRDVKFTDWNVTITTSFKTGKSRTVPLVISRAYLAQWRNDYPLTVTPDAFVFLTNRKNPLGYAGVAKQLRIIASRAGIKKHISPHLFRHSRATTLIRQGYGEAIVKKILWGNLNSKMFNTYLHLVDQDVEKVIAEKHGIIPKEHRERSKSLEPHQCPRCSEINPPTLAHCGVCGQPLTEEAMEREKIVRQQVDSHVDIKKLVEDEVRAALAKERRGKS